MPDRRRTTKSPAADPPVAKWPKSIEVGNGNTLITVSLDEDGSGHVLVDRDGRRTHRHDLMKEVPAPDPTVLRKNPRNARPR